MRTIERSARKAARPFAGVLCVMLAAAATAACTPDEILEVDNPDIIDPETVNNPQGVGALYAGALSELTSHMNSAFGLALVSALFTDEAMHASTPPAVREWDLRNVLTSNTSTPVLFLNLQKARARSEDAAARITTILGAPDARIGELWATAGFAYILFAELYCSGVPISHIDPLEYGPPLSTMQLLDLALERLTAAEGAAAGDTRVLNFIAVLRGRALLDKGEFAAAAQAVAGVPTGYTYAFVHSTTTPRQTNQIPVQFDADIFSVPDREGTNGLDYASAGDPRVPTRATGMSRNDGATPMVRFTKYASQSDPVVHASGVEARLIEAEAALRAGNASLYLSKLNEARATSPALAPLADPGTEDARVDLLFRERAFWMYLTAHRLGDLRRLVRQYGRSAETVFPTGAYHKQGLTRGIQVAFVIPQPEENNPNFDPSACDATIP